MRIGVDLDLTVIASDEAWFLWLAECCRGQYQHTPWPYFKQKIIETEGEIDYDLSKYFSEPINDNIDAYSFWRGGSIYDTVKAVPAAIEALTELSKKHELVFITTVKGDHHRSKYNFVERNVPKGFSFIATKEKWVLSSYIDVMIEDRVDILNKFSDRVIKIWYNTPYTQTEAPRQGVVNVDGWENILKMLGGNK